MYDVFLSYNRQDQETVESVGRALHERGLGAFVDRWSLVSGQSWVEALEKMIGDCAAVAIFVGRGGLGQWQQREKGLALHRQIQDPGFPVIPVILPGGDPALGFLNLNTWVDLRGGITAEAIEMLARAIRRQPPGEDLRRRAAKALAAVCPYRGLLPFREEDEPFFCGRQAFTATLTDAVAKRNLVAVVGASGSGKSSVVYAGLIPRLRRGAGRRAGHHVWDIVSVVPQNRPLHSLAQRFLSALQPDLGEVARLREEKELADHLMSGKIELRDVVASMLAKQPGTDRLLLVVDQWEELYTLCEERERQQFIEQLLQAVSNGRLTAVLTLRGDFYGHALGDRKLSDRLQGGVVNIAPMTRDELRCAIVEPVEKVALRFEEGLVERILNDVGDEPGRLPLLEFLLAELWQKRQGNTLEHDVYRASGGVSRAIAERAETSFGQLESHEQDQLHWAMVRLVVPGHGAEDMRRRAAITDLDPAARGVIEKLANDRLLVTTREPSGREIVEVGHEALIREWPRLKRWVDENRQDLRTLGKLEEEAGAWQDAGAPEDLLLRAGRRIAEAEELLKNVPRAIGPQVRAYVQASVDAEAQRQASIARAEAERQEQEKRIELERIERRHLEAEARRDKAEAERQLAQAEAARQAAEAGAAREYASRREQEANAALQREAAARRLALRTRVFAVAATALLLVASAAAYYAGEQTDKANAHFALALGGTTTVLNGVAANLNNGLISARVAEKLLKDAEKTLNQLHLAAPTADVAHAQINLLFAASDVLTKLGKLDEVHDRAAKAERLARHHWNSDSSKLRWERALYGSYFRIGDNHAGRGEYAAAFQAYQAGLEWAQRIAAADSSLQAQFSLSFLNNKLGDIAKIRGDLPGALRRYNASLQIIEKLVQQEPEKPEWLRQLSSTHTWIGGALALLDNLDEAVEHHWVALRIRKQLSDQDPSHAGLRSNLAASYARLGEALAARRDFDSALTHYRNALALRQRNVDSDQTNLDSHSQLAFSHIYIGDMLKEKGDMPAAMAEYNAALQIRHQLAKAQPSNLQWQENVAAALVRIGDAHFAADAKMAIESYRGSLAILEPLAKQHEGNIELSRDIFVSRVRVADALLAEKRVGEAVDGYRAALSDIAPLVAAKMSMKGAAWRLSVPAAHNRLAGALLAQGDTLGALGEHRIVQRMVVDHAEQIPANTRQKDAADSHRVAALVFAQTDAWERASHQLASAHGILKQLAAKDPKNNELRLALEETRRDVFAADVRIADALAASGANAEAVQKYRTALDDVTPIVAGKPNMTGWLVSVSGVHNKIARLLALRGEPDEALREYQRALQVAKDHSERMHADARDKDMVESRRGIGTILAATGDLKGAVDEFEHAQNILKQLLARDPTNKDWQIALEEMSVAFQTANEPGAAPAERR